MSVINPHWFEHLLAVVHLPDLELDYAVYSMHFEHDLYYKLDPEPDKQNIDENSLIKI
jgi:hypothetical protein